MIDRVVTILTLVVLPIVLVIVALEICACAMGWEKLEHVLRYVPPGTADFEPAQSELLALERALLRTSHGYDALYKDRNNHDMMWTDMRHRPPGPAVAAIAVGTDLSHTLWRDEKIFHLPTPESSTMRITLWRGAVGEEEALAARHFGIAVLGGDGSGYLLQLRSTTDPIMIEATVDRIEPSADNDSTKLSSAAFALEIARSKLLAPVPFGDDLRFVRVRLREAGIAAAFVDHILSDGIARSLRQVEPLKLEPLLELDEETSPRLAVLVEDLLLVATGTPSARDVSAADRGRMANLRFHGLVDRMEWQGRLLGSDWWGWIQLLTYLHLAFIVVAVVISHRDFARWASLRDAAEHMRDNIPQLAFIGTVIGISWALVPAYLVTSPNRLVKDQAIASITSDLGTAFNTTFVGLVCLLVCSSLVRVGRSK